MIKEKIKKFLGRDLLKQELKYSKELEWAQIYHDSIRGKEWLINLPLNIGRWAGNYSFFYVLHRILYDFKPKEILELGLGESSKFISVHLDNYLTDSNHTIIEHDIDWKSKFNESFTISLRSSIHILPLRTRTVQGFEINAYEKIGEFITKKYDLYLVDGPIGSPNYSRYDIIDIARNLNKNDDFIILLDDFDRNGEKQTFEELLIVLKENDIKINTGIYGGTKDVAIIGTDKYRLISTL